jgi:hypothetical protein
MLPFAPQAGGEAIRHHRERKIGSGKTDLSVAAGTSSRAGKNFP